MLRRLVVWVLLLLAAVVVPASAASAAEYIVNSVATCQSFQTAVGATVDTQTELCYLLGSPTIPAGTNVTTSGGWGLRPQGGTVTNDGVILGSAGSLFSLYQAATFINNGTVTANSDVRLGPGGVTNTGTLNLNARVLNQGLLINSGTVAFGSAGVLLLQADLANSGIVSFACGATLSVTGGAQVNGNAPSFGCGPTDIAVAPDVVTMPVASGATVGTLSAPGSNGTAPYTYTLLGGADKFAIDDTTLKTSAALLAGQHEAFVRVTDSKGAYTQEVLSITVSKASQPIGFTSSPPASPTVGGTYAPTTDSGGGSGNPVVLGVSTPTCSFAAGVVTFDHVGTCTVTASQEGDAAYAPGSASQNLSVAKAPQTVQITSIAPVGAAAQVGDVYSPTATSSGDGIPFFVQESPSCSVTPSGEVQLLAAGDCTISARASETADHLAAPSVLQTFTVHPAGEPSITATPSSATGFNAAGWSRSNVTVTFVCTPSPGATLVGDCPAARLKEKQVRNRIVRRTVTDSFGQTATTAVVVRIDKMAPSVRVGRVRNDATYVSPRQPRCIGADVFSGLKSCTLELKKKKRSDGTVVVTYTAVATDVADNSSTRRGRYFVV